MLTPAESGKISRFAIRFLHSMRESTDFGPGERLERTQATIDGLSKLQALGWLCAEDWEAIELSSVFHAMKLIEFRGQGGMLPKFRRTDDRLDSNPDE